MLTTIRTSTSTIALCVIVALTSFTHAEQISHRDPRALDILSRAATAAGGLQALTAIHNVTQSGNVVFHEGKGDTGGSVTISAIGENHFRVDAELRAGPRTWDVMNGRRTDHTTSVPDVARGTNKKDMTLGNFTLPCTFVKEALIDASTQASFVDVEQFDGREVYRIRLVGRLGLTNNQYSNDSAQKELLIDALNFDVLRMEDLSIVRYRSNGHVQPVSIQAVEFSDFRIVDNVRLPFVITMRVAGQVTADIHISRVVLNGGNLASELTDNNR